MDGIDRRTFLSGTATALAVTGGGCLADESASDGTMEPEPVTTTEPASTVQLATTEPTAIHEAVAPEVPEPFELAVSTDGGRTAVETAVADQIVTGDPPESFRTTLGTSLERYRIGVTVHPLPDGLDRAAYRDPVPSLVTFDGKAYAVPTGIDRVNWLFVQADHQESDAIEPTDGEWVARIASDDDPFVIPNTGRAVWRLFCLTLLDTAGVGAYRELSAGAGTITALREAAAVLCDRYTSTLSTVPDRTTAVERFRDGSASVVLGDASTARAIDADDSWVAFPAPGTSSTAVFTAYGWTVPKRARNPHGATAFRETIRRPAVQSEMAARSYMVPAHIDASVPPTPYPSLTAEGFEAVDRWLPSISTGCAHDLAARERAIRACDPDLVMAGDHETLGERLVTALH